jgi:chromosome segregation ATPase
MSTMSDQPLTLAVLAQFHRDVLTPEIERIVQASERRLRDEMHTLHDATLVRFERLEAENAAIKLGLVRVEERLDRVEQRLDRVEQRLDRVEQRLDSLETNHRQLAASLRLLDERLTRVEQRLEQLAAARIDGALRSEVKELRTRVDALQARIDAIEKRSQP